MPEERLSFEFEFDKVLSALVYLAKDKRVTKLDKKKAISLLFLADKAHLLRYGEPIFGESYRALEYGTVAEKTLDILNAFLGERFWNIRKEDIESIERSLEVVKLSDHKYPVLRAKVEPNLYALSDLEVKMLDDVIAAYGRKTFEELKGPIHPRAWQKAWDAKPPSSENAEIDYLDFFEGEDAEDARQHLIEQFRFRRALSGS